MKIKELFSGVSGSFSSTESTSRPPSTNVATSPTNDAAATISVRTPANSDGATRTPAELAQLKERVQSGEYARSIDSRKVAEAMIRDLF